MQARKHSWRKAVSFLNALFKPCNEYLVELIKWVSPVVLYINFPIFINVLPRLRHLILLIEPIFYSNFQHYGVQFPYQW